MTALNEARSNGKIVQKRAFVVEAMEAVIEVAMSASNGSFLIWNRLGLKMIIKTTGKAGIFLLRHSLTVQAKRNVLYTWDGEQEKSHT